MISGLGLLLDRLSSMGAAVPRRRAADAGKKARVWLGAQRGRLQVPAVHAGGKVDISCSNVKKNGGEQWAPHASTHHKALLAKSVERTPCVPAATSVSQSRIATLFSRAGPRADTGRNMARYNFVTERIALLLAECALPFRLADLGSFKKLLVDCSSKLHLTLANVGGQKAVRNAINSRAGLDILDMPAMQTKITAPLPPYPYELF